MKQAPGRLDKLDIVSQQWVFTDNDDVLKSIHARDVNRKEEDEDDGENSDCLNSVNVTSVSRPLTSGEDLLFSREHDINVSTRRDIPSSSSSVIGVSKFKDSLYDSVPTRDPQTQSQANLPLLRPSASISRLKTLGEYNNTAELSLKSSLQPSKHTLSATRLSTEDFLRSLQMETAVHAAVKSPSVNTNIVQTTNQVAKEKAHAVIDSVELYSCKSIRIELLSNWGDDSYIGLTGIQLLQGQDQDLTPVSLTADSVRTIPKDLSSVGAFDDPRVSANLVSSTNNTTDGMKTIYYGTLFITYSLL
jgi:hypothetical protein